MRVLVGAHVADREPVAVAVDRPCETLEVEDRLARHRAVAAAVDRRRAEAQAIVAAGSGVSRTAGRLWSCWRQGSHRRSTRRWRRR